MLDWPLPDTPCSSPPTIPQSGCSWPQRLTELPRDLGRGGSAGGMHPLGEENGVDRWSLLKDQVARASPALHGFGEYL